MDQRMFAESVMARLQQGSIIEKSPMERSFSMAAAARSKQVHEARAFGHPAFEDLGVGYMAFRYAAVCFIDLRRFTSRSFWDPPEDVVRVSAAVLTELAESVSRHGGHVLGLRGDGVFSCFDVSPTESQELLGGAAAVGCAVVAAAFALDAVRNALNPLLESSGVEPVQVRAGIDFGRIGFVRVGAGERSEVNVEGFAANCASKCEKKALAWEVVVGERCADLLRTGTTKWSGRFAYQRGDDQRTYNYYRVDWLPYLKFAAGVQADLLGSPTSSIRYR